jgi:hypothetical protein
MLRKFASAGLAVLALGVCGCKGVDDWLVDLQQIDSPRAGGNLLDQETFVFDSGQLIHEALAGLAQAEELQRWQAMRALSRAAVVLDPSNKDALLRADAAMLIGRLTTRVPVPPIVEPFEIVDYERGQTLAKAQVETIDQAGKVLAPGKWVESLESPDAIERQNAVANLKRETQLDFKTNEEWITWWTDEKPRRRQAFVDACKEPARILGSIKFKTPSPARAVLGLLAFLMRDFQDPAQVEVIWPSVLRVARQTVNLSLARAIDDPNALVRADVAESMAMIRDPAFGEPLARQLRKDRDPVSATEIIRALTFYPSRTTIAVLIDALRYEEQRISSLAADALFTLTGLDLGMSFEAWSNWWADSGAAMWPS